MVNVIHGLKYTSLITCRLRTSMRQVVLPSWARAHRHLSVLRLDPRTTAPQHDLQGLGLHRQLRGVLYSTNSSAPECRMFSLALQKAPCGICTYNQGLDWSRASQTYASRAYVSALWRLVRQPRNWPHDKRCCSIHQMDS